MEKTTVSMEDGGEDDADEGVENVHDPSIRFSNDTDMEYKPSLAYGEEKTSPVYFTGYALPPGNPCESFALPPSPADKKRTGPRPCPVCYLPVKQAIALMPNAPSVSPVLKNLTYVYEENSTETEFGGYPSLKQRDDYYDIRESMTVHCGQDLSKELELVEGLDMTLTMLIFMIWISAVGLLLHWQYLEILMYYDNQRIW